MKSTLYTALITAIFYNTLVVSEAFGAETAKTFSVGLTHTNNISIQSSSGINLESIETSTRNGLETRASWLKQELDYTGGYALEVQGSYNKGLGGFGDINNLGLSASKLKALNSDWLMRSRVDAQQYRNSDIPVDSFNGVRFENTFGYLASDNSGVDINLSIAYENHSQDAEDIYKKQSKAIKLSRYFSHTPNVPYWAIHATVASNTTDGSLRDNNSLAVMAEYRNWSLGSFRGTAGAYWRRDIYDERVRVSSTGRFLTPRLVRRFNIRDDGRGNLTEQDRIDNVSFAQVGLNKTIKKNLTWQLSANLGHYDSTITDISDSYYLLSSQLQWHF